MDIWWHVVIDNCQESPAGVVSDCADEGIVEVPGDSGNGRRAVA